MLTEPGGTRAASRDGMDRPGFRSEEVRQPEARYASLLGAGSIEVEWGPAPEAKHESTPQSEKGAG